MTILSSLSKADSIKSLTTTSLASAGAVGIATVIVALEKNWISVGFLLLVLALSLLSSFYSRLVASRVNHIVDTLSQSATGKLDARVVRLGETEGLLATLSIKANRTLDLAEAFTKEADAAMKAASMRRYYRRIITTGMTGGYRNYSTTINQTLEGMVKHDAEVSEFVDRNVRAVAETVATSAAGLNGHITTIGIFSDETKEKASTANEAANRTQMNMQAVAAAIEEFSASIGEIASQTNRVASYATEAVTTVEKTSLIVHSLDDAAKRIGSVVEMISDIANQTNLLALNATIEAARAGEAGKGFAVVASEVKSLATQTGKSTEEITTQINAVQNVVNQVSEAIHDISEKVRTIGESSSTVASAVEEQRAVTQSISGNVNEVSSAANEVTRLMDTVSMTATESNKVVKEISTSSAYMASEADRLRKQIGGFMEKITEVR